uniref:Secreted protein n=1 Tax=Acrobeloides nanus TaxID=290746 RepID=A0A914C8H4_9BILA
MNTMTKNGMIIVLVFSFIIPFLSSRFCVLFLSVPLLCMLPDPPHNYCVGPQSKFCLGYFHSAYEIHALRYSALNSCELLVYPA